MNFDPSPEILAGRIRPELAAIDADASRHLEAFSGDGPTLLVRTKTLTAYPTAAERFFACEPAAILGVEVEGGAGSLEPAAGTLFAFNLGGAVPPPGTYLLVTFLQNRWVFRHDG